MIRLNDNQKEVIHDLIGDWFNPERVEPYVWTHRTRIARSLVRYGLFEHRTEDWGFVHPHQYLPTQVGLGVGYELFPELFTFLPVGSRVIVGRRWVLRGRFAYQSEAIGKRWGTIVGHGSLMQGQTRQSQNSDGPVWDKATVTYVVAYKVKLDGNVGGHYDPLPVPINGLEVVDNDHS